MVNTDLILKFDNTTNAPLYIVIDPPAIDYKLESGQSLKLKIIDYRSCKDDVSDIINFRYTTQNIINIDINYNFRLVVIIDNKEEVI